MARIVVLGAGISGHTAAMHLRRKLSKSQHQIVVITPNSNFNWIPSNIWVGTGKMEKRKVVFPLAPVYRRKGIIYHQGRATVIYPQGLGDDTRPMVELVSTAKRNAGDIARVHYDYLINATGPKLNFEATAGLGPEIGFTHSVCTADHAVEAGKAFLALVEELRALPEGETKRLVIGTGNGTCTCQGAAFEYCFNVEYDLRQAQVRDKAEVVYLTNEAELGDFGVGGMEFNNNGYATNSQLWTESLFRERGIKAITGAAVQEVRKESLTFENLDGDIHDLDYDFAMLLPPFAGVGLKAKTNDGTDITSQIFAPSGFMKVDGDYTAKPYEQWRAADWPRTYQNSDFPNIFAVGIAFAPPHAISKPHKTKNGTLIAPAPPRTGMPSGTIGKEVALSIIEMIRNPKTARLHEASLADLAAVCVASTGTGMLKGSAAAMTMHPIVRDESVYPGQGGRNIKQTRGEIGLFGHWTKYLLHVMFKYKAKGYPLWHLIPE